MRDVKCFCAINAPIEMVFNTVADIREFRNAVPTIVDVEFLSEQHLGVGTRFRETRDMRRRKPTTELEVTEYVQNDHVRIVTDAHGTIWDTIFAVEPAGQSTKLQMTMEAHTSKFLPKLMNPLVMKRVAKGIVSDMDSVKYYCETHS